MYIEVNNTRLFYILEGNGEPIILVHGNGESHKIFKDTVADLSKNYAVYAIDMRGQGASDKIAELHYDDMADDILEFINKLCIKNPYYFGFSDGGIVGLLAASKQSACFKKMMIAGVNTKPNAIKKRWYNFFKLWYFFTKNQIMKVMFNEPNITKQDLMKIDVKTVVVMGQRDCICDEEGRFIANNLQDGKLMVLKNENHMSYVFNNKKLTDLLCKHLLNESN